MATILNASLGETTLLQNELRMGAMGGGPAYGSAYDFGHVQSGPPPSSYMKRNNASRAGGLATAYGGPPPADGPLRPMTSNRSAGYTAGKVQAATGVPGGEPFDPLPEKAAKPLQKKAELSPEEKLREMEREIHRLVEESALTREKGEVAQALEKAKEAGKRERQLCRLRDQQGMLEQLNVDLTYAVCLNLAIQQQAGGNDQEAYTIYSQIVKNKQYPYAGRFRVNMGNICFAQGRYPTAIKMYRMALDQIPANVQGIRFKILRNIGHAFFAMRQFTDAAESYENLLSQDGQFLDFMTGFNLILCYYALGDKEKMQQGFVRMLSIQQVGLEDADDENEDPDSPVVGAAGKAFEELDKGVDAMDKDDALREDIKKRQRDAARYILNAAQLIAPTIEKTAVAGFDWVIDALTKNGFPGIGSELEIGKASYHLRRKEFDAAIDILKRFERKDASLMARAATNLSFLYFLEGDFLQAERYADVAVKADRYNSRALVNKGNCLFVAAEFDRAKEVYLESIGVSADCLEAIYNLGIVNVHTGRHQEAMLAFDKLNSITHHNCEVMWQLGDLYEKLGDNTKAHEWFSLVVTEGKGRPTDPGALARIANLFAKQDDETQSFHYNLESYRYWPVDLNVITWLGIYYVKQELYEQAIPYFQRAADVQPLESKWLLMVASCHRRMNAYPQALALYEEIHRRFPRDMECLRYLVTICKELNIPHEHHATALRKLERLEEAQQAQQMEEEGAPPFGYSEAAMGEEPRFQELSPDFPAPGPGPIDDGLPMPAPKPKRVIKQAAKKVEEEEDEDWGDLGDDLLPGL